MHQIMAAAQQTDRQGQRASMEGGGPSPLQRISVWLRPKQKAKGRDRQPSKRDAEGQEAMHRAGIGSPAKGTPKGKRQSKGQRQAAKQKAC